MFGKIKITDFGKRHFDTKFGGTKITDKTPEEFEKILNDSIVFNTNVDSIETVNALFDGGVGSIKILDGYAPFCKLIAIPNFTNARVGSLPLKLENYQFIRHGYSARTEKELPVLSRWFELPLGAPIADYLIVIVYSKEQIDKEGRITEGEGGNPNEKYIPLDAEWGIVAILGQTHSGEEPMQPQTMMRNALGPTEGGSGVPLDREKYVASVEFWKNNAILKS